MKDKQIIYHEKKEEIAMMKHLKFVNFPTLFDGLDQSNNNFLMDVRIISFIYYEYGWFINTKFIAWFHSEMSICLFTTENLQLTAKAAINTSI